MSKSILCSEELHFDYSKKEIKEDIYTLEKHDIVPYHVTIFADFKVLDISGIYIVVLKDLLLNADSGEGNISTKIGNFKINYTTGYLFVPKIKCVFWKGLERYRLLNLKVEYMYEES